MWPQHVRELCQCSVATWPRARSKKFKKKKRAPDLIHCVCVCVCVCVCSVLCCDLTQHKKNRHRRKGGEVKRGQNGLLDHAIQRRVASPFATFQSGKKRDCRIHADKTQPHHPNTTKSVARGCNAATPDRPLACVALIIFCSPCLFALVFLIVLFVGWAPGCELALPFAQHTRVSQCHDDFSSLGLGVLLCCPHSSM